MVESTETKIAESGIVGNGTIESGPGPTGWVGTAQTLATMPPGPELGALLEGLDRSQLNGYELVAVIGARARQIAHLEAQQYADSVELSYCPPCRADSAPERQKEPNFDVADELRLALRWTRRHSDNHFHLGWQLVEQLPQVWEALDRGTIDAARARIIVEGTDHLDRDVARRVAARALEVAPGLTTGQIGARIRRWCIEADPEDAARRFRQSNAGRRVVSQPNPDGTGNLTGFNLAPDRIAAILSHINHLARTNQRADDPRSIDQIRADIFTELLQGHHHGGRNARGPDVELRVDLPTLVGLNDQAAEIPGWGPVIADIARQAIQRGPDGSWQIVVTDPDTGAVLWNGTTRRRPTASQRRHVQTRQPTCLFPTCRQPSTQADLDHTTARADDGPTKTPNLGPLCRHDHTLKHTPGWQLERVGSGTYQWTTPHGHTYGTGLPP